MSSTVLTRSAAQKSKMQTRAMVKSVEQQNPKPRITLQELKRKAKQTKMQAAQHQDCVLKDIFQNAVDAKKMISGRTGLVYDEQMSLHCCLWDQKHPECPERFLRTLERCKELGLVDRCVIFPSRRASKEEVTTLHTDEHYELLEKTSQVKDDDNMEELSSLFDSIYIHPTTFELALLAVGSTIDLVDRVTTDKIQNGMAIIRPPGHHAMKREFNGYCFFNNVALAAQHALDKLNLNRIMIIDWDVHHGQGTQRFFYNDNRVLYFSIHRFEHGTFWPNLMESDYDVIGSGNGLGYNFNVPLNKKGMGNGDYLAIFQQLIIPVAAEYRPELIIISAGYDAALGCPEGEMEVTPAFYPHLINPLLKMYKVAVVLEGGYCLESLSEGAALTLRALLGDPCPELVEKIQPPCKEIQETIYNCIFAHRPYWRCLQIRPTYTIEEFNSIKPTPEHFHKLTKHFIGGDPLPERFPTRGTAPNIPADVTLKNLERLQKLRNETKLFTPQVRVCYVYDDFMLQHRNSFEDGHPEQPERIAKIFDMHKEYELLSRMKKLNSRLATTAEICLAHTRTYLNSIRRINEKDQLQELGSKYNSVYFHPKTFDCATMAAGSVLQVVDEVVSGKSRSGICIVRPPGHHAESDQPHGFCIFNNVAIAAQYAVAERGLKRVLIVDWDVHHGNGTQHIFESNPNVLYISVHRYDNANFFPKSQDANYDVVGKGDGIGFNVNIPWNRKGMGDFEYILAFQQLIMPIAYEFDPELVLVSAGFDAAIGDPLGGCKVTPEAYGLFTHWLSALANGRIIVCLEGGYNVNSISYAMTMCTKSLLGDPLPSVQLNGDVANLPSSAFLSCATTIQQCLDVQKNYWKSLAFNKSLLQTNVCGNNNEDFLSVTLKNLNITKDDAPDAVGTSIPTIIQTDEKPSGSKPKVKNKTLTEYINEIKDFGDTDFYAIVPLKTCPHLNVLHPEDAPSIIRTDAPCIECSSTAENWFCLSCYQVFCGRYVSEHMVQHNLKTEHPLALSFSDISVWCYPCEAYIDNVKLHLFKNLAHRYKFNEEMQWSYDTINNNNTFKINRAINNPTNPDNDNDVDDDDDFNDDNTNLYNDKNANINKFKNNKQNNGNEQSQKEEKEPIYICLEKDN